MVDQLSRKVRLRVKTISQERRNEIAQEIIDEYNNKIEQMNYLGKDKENE